MSDSLTGPAPLLRVEDLTVDYLTDTGVVHALDGVSFSIGAGEIFGLCGESGSGKSTLALALPRLLAPPAVITRGRVQLEGQDLLTLSARGISTLRGRRVGLIPQSGMNALHPQLSVARQITNALGAAGSFERSVNELLALVGLPATTGSAFPHQLSGGMRQRAAIAIALAQEPALLIVDEGLGALDVAVRRQICETLASLSRKRGFGILFISHDLPLTLALADRVAVLYAGQLVEVAAAEALRTRPLHPYSAALLACFLGPHERPLQLAGIAGTAPDARDTPAGCAFCPRCTSVFSPCPTVRPALLPGTANRLVACHLHRTP